MYSRTLRVPLFCHDSRATNTPRSSSDLTSMKPKMPPINPPVACKPANNQTVPYTLVIMLGVMKKLPIITPATAPEIVDRATKLTLLDLGLLKHVLYPTILVVISKRTLATVNAMKWRAVGRRTRLITVAMTPTAVAVPSFLVHHTAMMRQVKPIRSQAKGRWVIVQKTGEIVTLRTPHRAAHMEIATMSRLLK